MAAIGTGFNAGATEDALAITGSDNNAIAKDGAIALGMNSKFNSGLEFGNTTGNVTIGETGLGQTFANTVRELTTSNQSALAAALASGAQANLPNANTDLQAATTAVQESQKNRFWLIAGVVATVLSIVLYITRRK